MLLKPLLLSSLLTLSPAAIIPQEKASDGKQCNCEGINVRENQTLRDTYICGDKRLGPRNLPAKLPLATFVTGYDRFGGLTPDEFLQKWWNTTDRGDGNEAGWIYPEKYGFELNEDLLPIKANVDLKPETLVDRFGENTGRYISPATAPFAQRALHPQNLDTGKNKEFPNNYHVYKVTRTFTVQAGPIRPWFGQPGFGVQFFLGNGITVHDYIVNGHLKELDASDLVRTGTGCGFDREEDGSVDEEL
ncbi:hypothetical protein F66182_1549 [Fusarium sp. NRRL 66182]|nr:hypothetical protein F66182_1549 [Fusarium sp. NRRL 66182]